MSDTERRPTRAELIREVLSGYHGGGRTEWDALAEAIDDAIDEWDPDRSHLGAERIEMMATTSEMLAETVESWALPFHYHRDLMNAHLHGTIHVKWSEVTRQLALGLAVLDRYSYEMSKVMYSWDVADPELDEDERAAIKRWEGTL